MSHGGWIFSHVKENPQILWDKKHIKYKEKAYKYGDIVMGFKNWNWHLIYQLIKLFVYVTMCMKGLDPTLQFHECVLRYCFYWVGLVCWTYLREWTILYSCSKEQDKCKNTSRYPYEVHNHKFTNFFHLASF